MPERPYCMVVQPGVVDPTRAPAGQHTFWAYCHVPAGQPVDMTGRIEAQVERFAPGFRDLILARSVADRGGHGAVQPQLRRRRHQRRGGHAAPDLAAHARGGTPTGPPFPGVYLCSSSTPPGGGVHGMCGGGAARAALADLHLPEPVSRAARGAG